MPELSIDYPRRVQVALLQVVREVLTQVAEEGFPGDHFAYVGFRTDYPGVVIPESVRSQYPEEMTIVLQHQFWDLSVDSESFSVTLRFAGRPEHLTVPFLAVRSYVDPAAEFGLHFQPTDGTAPVTEKSEAVEDVKPSATPEGVAEVVQLDRFRKRGPDA